MNNIAILARHTTNNPVTHSIGRLTGILNDIKGERVNVNESGYVYKDPIQITDKEYQLLTHIDVKDRLSHLYNIRNPTFIVPEAIIHNGFQFDTVVPELTLEKRDNEIIVLSRENNEVDIHEDKIELLIQHLRDIRKL